jgi:hypothetical protein
VLLQEGREEKRLREERKEGRKKYGYGYSTVRHGGHQLPELNRAILLLVPLTAESGVAVEDDTIVGDAVEPAGIAGMAEEESALACCWS